MLVEHEYERGGALAYLAAWDVRQAELFGRCEAKTGIEPFGRLVTQVMEQEPYFSIVQRKVLTPNDFPSLEGVEARLLAFQDHYEALARPLWKFTRNDLKAMLARLATHDEALLLCA